MSITFHKIRYQNFLATGNYFNEIQLDVHPRVLLAGKNGSGKSTIMDALCYVLYNKAFRRVNKPQLVNSITQKNCLVELEFTDGNTEYLIRRGQKPGIFEIYRNGSLIEQSANSRDYQDILEKTILKIDYRTFCQIVILGDANYVPFMQLPTNARRQIIENLLDIELFSVMNSILKERAVNNRSKIEHLNNDIRLLEKTIELNEKHKRQVKQSNQQNISKKRKQIEVNTRKIETLNKKNISLGEKLQKLKEKLKKTEELDAKIKKSTQAEHLIINKMNTLKSEINYYQKTDECSTCKQEINEEFKNNILEDLTYRYDTYAEKLTDLENIITKIKDQQDSFKKYFDAHDQVNSEMQKNSNDIAICMQFNKSLDKEIEELENLDLKVDNSIAEKSRLKAARKDLEDLINKRELYNVALLLLKDNGIKSQIIKQYIPVINKLINANLEKLGFFCKFEFDENFEEKIKSRHRDSFSYASFSQGEKMRIDLSLLFAWREIVRMRNISPINLLILDEIMDSSLDENGTEEFLDIVSTFAERNNIFIISHKHHQIADKFDDTLYFESHKNFSRIVK